MAWAEDEAMHRPHVGLEADYDEDQEDLFGDDDGPEESHPDVDEAHVLLLTAANFTSVLAARRHVMVEFYAPWCGHCLALAPHYAAAAAASLAEQGIDVVLAKVDATEDHDLAQAHDVQGYPTLLFLIDDVPRDYSGERTKDAIMAWVGKKLGTAVENLTAVDEAEKVVTSDNVAMLAYLHYLSTRYIKDCKRLYGRILDSNSVKSSIQAKTKDRSEKVWTENRKPPATSPTRAPCAAEEGMAMSDMPDYVIVLLVERHPGCSKFNNLFMLNSYLIPLFDSPLDLCLV